MQGHTDMIFLLGLLWGCLDQLEQHLPMLERFHCFELGRSWTDNMRNETDALDYLSDFALMVTHYFHAWRTFYKLGFNSCHRGIVSPSIDTASFN